MRRAGFAAAALVLACVASGCGDDAGPLELVGYGGMVVDGGQAPDVWFRVQGCLADDSDPVDLMVTGVSTEPASDHVEARVTWNDDSEIVVAKPGQPPSAYQPVTATSHTGGTLDGCSLDLAVVLSTDTRPVTVEAVTVHYEIDGDEHSVRTTLGGTLCPEGSVAADTSDGCRSK